jgi:hypothetical protein
MVLLEDDLFWKHSATTYGRWNFSNFEFEKYLVCCHCKYDSLYAVVILHFQDRWVVEDKETTFAYMQVVFYSINVLLHKKMWDADVFNDVNQLLIQPLYEIRSFSTLHSMMLICVLYKCLQFIKHNFITTNYYICLSCCLMESLSRTRNIPNRILNDEVSNFVILLFT